jgi:hypothetical protein
MRRLSRRGQLAISALAIAFLAILLYWPSLALPVIYDDLLHIRIVKGLNLRTVWLPTGEFGFYRPLTFLPLILIKRAFGYYPNWLLHGLNVVQHSLNAVLLVALAARLGFSRFQSVAAGLLFAFFPFSYQAVAVYGHNVHPTLTGLFLMGLHSYLTAIRLTSNQQRDGRWRRWLWWGITGFIFLLSLLSHESAILFGAFAALLHWHERGRLPELKLSRQWFQLRRVPPWLVFVLLGGVYFVVYQFLPITRGPQASGEEGGYWLRIFYLLQAAAYPLTWFAHLVPQLDAKSVISIGLGVTLILTIWAARTHDTRWSLLLAWGWWGLASILIAVPLPASYLLHGPRLLYLGSLGLALLWPLLLYSSRSGAWRNRLSLLLIALILVTDWRFVRDRLDQYRLLTRPIDTIAGIMAQQPSEEGVVVVNIPQWIAPQRNTFALGAELVAMLGNHLFADEIIAENLPGQHAVYAVVEPDLLRKTAYPYGIHDETTFRGDAAATLPIRSDWSARGSQVFIIEYTADGPETKHTGAFQQVGVHLSPIASFTSYDLINAQATLCDGQVQATLLWEQTPGEVITPTLSIFVQLLVEDGRLMAQADGPPLGLRADLVQLLPGWEIQDRRSLQPSLPGQPEQILIGVYDFVTGDRLPAHDDRQRNLPDDLFRLPVTACPG